MPDASALASVNTHGEKSVMRSLPKSEVLRVKKLLLRYFKKNAFINNTKLRELTGLSYDQAIWFFGQMLSEGTLERIGKTSSTKYILPNAKAPSPDSVP